jgi:hypothetical protein
MTEGRGPYIGQTKKLLVSVDLGTTFTAVSFALLCPGEVPTFNDVSLAIIYCPIHSTVMIQIQRWPKQV